MVEAEKPSLMELYTLPLAILGLVAIYTSMLYVFGNLKNEQPPSDIGEELDRRL